MRIGNWRENAFILAIGASLLFSVAALYKVWRRKVCDARPLLLDVVLIGALFAFLFVFLTACAVKMRQTGLLPLLDSPIANYTFRVRRPEQAIVLIPEADGEARDNGGLTAALAQTRNIKHFSSRREVTFSPGTDRFKVVLTVTPGAELWFDEVHPGGVSENGK